MEAKHTTGIVNTEVPPQYHQTLSTIIEALIKPECFKWDLFIALLLIVMKENDFLLLKAAEGGSMAIEDYVLCKKTKHSSIHEAVFILNGFQNMPLKIITCPLNDATLIIATVPELYKETYSLCIKISSYISTSTLGIPSDYRNLKELITVFKDKIVNPVKGGILNYHKYPSPNLFGLPDDVVHKILHSLAVGDVLNVGETCKTLHRIVKEDSLWFRLLTRDFPNEDKSDGDTFREKYVKLYALVQESRLKSGYYGSAACQEFAHLSRFMTRVSDSRWELIL